MALNDIEHLPKVVTNIAGINDVLLAIDPEIIQMRTDISNLLKELYIRTTDALITRWENDFSLKYDASLSLAQRRQRVLNKLARKKVLTWKNLRALIKSNIGENAQFYISNDSANYYFRIMIAPEMEEVFDRSKFTVVGSPTITEDGIARGFSASNFITIANPLIGATKYTIKAKFTLPSTTSSGYGYVFADTNGTTGLSIYYDRNSVIVRCASQTTVNRIGSSTANSVWEVEVIYDNRTAIANYIKNGVSGTKTLNTTGYTDFQATNLFIGQRSGSDMGTAYFKGSIDLKQFSITVDGVEVFNGTKTVPKGIAELQQAIKQAKPAYLLFDIIVTDIVRRCGTFNCGTNPL